MDILQKMGLVQSFCQLDSCSLYKQSMELSGRSPRGGALPGRQGGGSIEFESGSTFSESSIRSAQPSQFIWNLVTRGFDAKIFLWSWKVNWKIKVNGMPFKNCYNFKRYVTFSKDGQFRNSFTDQLITRFNWLDWFIQQTSIHRTCVYLYFLITLAWILYKHPFAI